MAEIKIEGLGFYAPGATNPMQFLDRDPSGFVVAAHWNGGHSNWQPENAYHQMCSTQDLSGSVLYEPGPDGVSDGINTIQGVRNFDPTLGTWSAPDAYAGDSTDPMSRKAYMWNRNNAFEYADPTGYVPALGAAAGGTIVCIVIEPCGAAEAIGGAIAGGVVVIVVGGAFVWRAMHHNGVPAPGAAPRPAGVPQDWGSAVSDNGRGTIWSKDSYNNVRFDPGDPNRKDPNERGPYVKVKIGGKSRDIDGNPVPDNSPEAHIKPQDFDFSRIMHGVVPNESVTF